MNNIPSVYNFNNYKDFLAKVIHLSPKGILTRLSEAAGCQRSYLSEAMNGLVQLTPDHAFGIAKYLELAEEEYEFFQKLVLLARSSAKEYRASLQASIERIQEDRRRITKRVASAETLDLERSARYYESWHPAAVHIATSINTLNSAAAIAAKLRLPESLVRDIVNQLVADGYIKSKQGTVSYNYEHKNLHLPDDSPFNRLNHMNWRSYVMSRNQKMSSDVQYSSVFSISKNDLKKLRENLLDCVDRQRKITDASGCEELVVCLYDLFQI